MDLVEIAATENNITMTNVVARASHELKLGEKRLICSALSSLDSMTAKRLFDAHVKNGFSVRISAQDYAAQFNLDESTAYAQMKESCDLLFERHIRFEEKAKRGVVVRKIRWVSEAKYAKGEGWVELFFTHQVAPHVLGLRSNFTTYKLKHAAGLDTTYAWKLYECLMSWKSTGRYSVTVEEFHKVMETPISFQQNFKDLRVRVIEPSVKSINARTDLIVQYSTIKHVRKVVGLEFRFMQNPQAGLDLTASDTK
jgi:plasmid replication initiation protein|nr:plasmid replication initiation protein RepB [uncultured bacterium]